MTDDGGSRWGLGSHEVFRLILAASVAAGFVVAAALVAGTSSESRDAFRTSAAGTLLTVAGGIVLTGVVAVVLERLREREAGRLADRQFLEAQIVKLWDMHEMVKRAAVLIAAHQTAKTYGEQLRLVIGVRTTLSDVHGVVERRRHRIEGLRWREFESMLNGALSALNPLIDEYRREYLDVSFLQRADEARNKRLAEDAAGDDEQIELEVRSHRAWDRLLDKQRFEHAAALIEFGELEAYDFETQGSREKPGATWADAALTVRILDRIAIAAEALGAFDRSAEQRLGDRIAAHQDRLDALDAA